MQKMLHHEMWFLWVIRTNKKSLRVQYFYKTLFFADVGFLSKGEKSHTIPKFCTTYFIWGYLFLGLWPQDISTARCQIFNQSNRHPTERLCILVPAHLFLDLVPYLHSFSAVEFMCKCYLIQICIICKFNIMSKKNGAGTALSNCALEDQK